MIDCLFDGMLSKDFDALHRGLGGNGNMLIARSGGSSTDQNTAWTNLGTGLGTVTMNATDTTKSGGTYGTNTNVGFRDLTSSNQTIMLIIWMIHLGSTCLMKNMKL